MTILVPTDQPTIAAALAAVALDEEIHLEASASPFNEWDLVVATRCKVKTKPGDATVTVTGAAGFHVFRANAGGTFEDMILAGYDATHYGLSLTANPSTLRDLVFTGAGKGAYAGAGTHSAYRCKATAGAACLDFYQGTGSHMENCQAYDTTLGFVPGTNDTVYHCRSQRPVQRGFDVRRACTVRNCGAYDGVADGFYIGLAGADVDYCNGYGNATNNFNELAAAKGANCIESDPLFVDAPGGDYHLQWGSPCIFAGVGGLGVTDDYDGNARPVGAGPDIGDYEFQDATPPVIMHTPVTTAPVAQDVDIFCHVEDADSGVWGAFVYYRATGGSGWSFAALTHDGGGYYSGAIPGAVVTTAGVDYYLYAEDGVGNPATHPAGAP